jgi:2-oxoglutarate dehydrogenase E2 component (dihydrolipoamide succinyltransferase)
MPIQIKAPAFPESIADGEIAAWHKKEGDSVSRDELIVEIETDKVVMEVVAPADGVMGKIHVAEGETIASEALLADFSEGEVGDQAESAPTQATEDAAPAPEASGSPDMGPAARQMIAEHRLDPAAIPGTGKGGRVTKEDVTSYLEKQSSSAQSNAPSAPAAELGRAAAVVGGPSGPTSERVEKRVPMTRMRAKIAERLLDASQSTAMLTTFNEVNMAPVMALRKKYRDQFEKTHNGTRLGFMGFFVKAACEALKRYPAVNASVDGSDVVYHGYQDIGVAVSTEGGLVVPVLRDADFMSLADVEAEYEAINSNATSSAFILLAPVWRVSQRPRPRGNACQTD